MNDVLAEFSGVKISVTEAGCAIALLTLFLFMAIWLLDRKKRTGSPAFPGRAVNSAGFALLPAVAVLKVFQDMSTGKGAAADGEAAMIRWFIQDGFYRPGTIEAAAAVIGFTGLCIWLMARRKELPENGDLLLISLCLWAAIRMMTEDFHEAPGMLFRYTSCGTMLLCMLIWLIRLTWLSHSPVRMILNLLAGGCCAAVHLFTAAGWLSAGSGMGNFAVKAGSALLLLLLALMAGGDLRMISQRLERQSD